MTPYERHVFICENLRDSANPKGCCSARGSAEIRSRLRQLAVDAGLKGIVRINSAGCLGQCAQGVTIVVYPEVVWYGKVTLDDVELIFKEHILNGRPVERLRISTDPHRETR